MRVSVLGFVALDAASAAADPSPEATSVLDREGAAVSGVGSGDKMVDRESIVRPSQERPGIWGHGRKTMSA